MSDEFERLVGNIREELQAQDALQDLGLAPEVLTQLAASVAANIDYAFDVRWSPRWEGKRRDKPSST
jgi:hypothetical protein